MRPYHCARPNNTAPEKIAVSALLAVCCLLPSNAPATELPLVTARQVGVLEADFTYPSDVSTYWTESTNASPYSVPRASSCAPSLPKAYLTLPWAWT